jgi:hypothetical protein
MVDPPGSLVTPVIVASAPPISLGVVTAGVTTETVGGCLLYLK